MTLNMSSEMPRGGTLCLSHPELTIGGDATKIKTAAPNGLGVDYAIDGIIYNVLDTVGDRSVTAAAIQAELTSCIYLVTLNAAGTLATVKGTAVLSADITAGKKPLTWPAPAVNTCPIGAIKVVTTSGNDFTAGTDDWNDAGSAFTWYDFMAIPTTPITA